MIPCVRRSRSTRCTLGSAALASDASSGWVSGHWITDRLPVAVPYVTAISCSTRYSRVWMPPSLKSIRRASAARVLATIDLLTARDKSGSCRRLATNSLALMKRPATAPQVTTLAERGPSSSAANSPTRSPVIRIDSKAARPPETRPVTLTTPSRMTMTNRD